MSRLLFLCARGYADSFLRRTSVRPRPPPLRVESARLEVDGTTAAEIDEALLMLLSVVVEEAGVLDESRATDGVALDSDRRSDRG